ncbi:MAG: hypothetical protein K2Y01_08530 [Rhabdochlamydiaceae bacterium]|nr:hypothetical protein [Rhabdochlamydiaceae bacterium]
MNDKDCKANHFEVVLGMVQTLASLKTKKPFSYYQEKGSIIISEEVGFEPKDCRNDPFLCYNTFRQKKGL